MRFLRLTAMVLVLLLAFPAHLMAAPVVVDTTRLSAGDVTLDGQVVTFRGEAIGEALKAGDDYRWVNVLSDGVAIGVYTTEDSLDGIDGYGDYDKTGTMVEIVGVHHVACDQHGGDLDVHATAVRVLDGAVERDHPIHPEKAAAAFLALGVTAGIFARYRLLRRREQ